MRLRLGNSSWVDSFSFHCNVFIHLQVKDFSHFMCWQLSDMIEAILLFSFKLFYNFNIHISTYLIYPEFIFSLVWGMILCITTVIPHGWAITSNNRVNNQDFLPAPKCHFWHISKIQIVVGMLEAIYYLLGQPLLLVFIFPYEF